MIRCECCKMILFANGSTSQEKIMDMPDYNKNVKRAFNPYPWNL